MRGNMGTVDRVIRSAIGVVMAGVGFGVMAGGGGIAVGVIGIVFLATGLVGFCPLYVPLHFNTHKVR